MTEYQTTLTENTPIAITIGNFDGIHLGHQLLLQEVRAMAQTLDCTPVMVTFEPHTLMVVRPDIHVQYLTTLGEKLALAKEYGGVADSIVINFTPEVAALSAQDFMDDLCQRFTIRGLIVGSDFSLGHNRMGNVSFLEAYGQKNGMLVRALPLEQSGETRISSTRIRALINAGNVAEANTLLGHPVVLGGIVGHGDERGRQIGFPTANLRLDAHKLVPTNGVYAVRATVHRSTIRDRIEDSTVYNGVSNIGIRPTFNGKERLVEVHLLDVTMDLYDAYLHVEFIEHLRGEQRFSGIEALKQQIEIDAQQARQILASRRMDH
ncbi:bifunctional riboflavin kinase/FAD synthetase [Dictyobacter arantiisoli]|uniref:Riboflavin biosynthesis protein n=1 Tax=Dictyobacter arantiisoli TaxID=2014874 RepID=A0A5A5T6G5_9CHLR|nr:bifunctional riboflavin kinase/FAD synthetase [Dictyobacter arantiisoli]GCF07050.1 riboflavin biosynthesis protein [Dictyobacter arantiisoli]